MAPSKKKAAAKKPLGQKAKKPTKGGTAGPRRIAYHERLGLSKDQAYFLGITAALVFAVAVYFAFSSAHQIPAAPPAIEAPQQEVGTVLTVVDDPSCTFCNKFIKPVESQIMEAAFSGLSIRQVSASSKEGKLLISSLGIKALPAYVFNSHVAAEENYSVFKPFLHKANGSYLLDEKTIRGVAVRYFSPPPTGGEPSLGAPDAAVTIIVFSDPACKACKVFGLKTLPFLESAYNSTVRVVFKALPLSPSTLNASIAMECAAGQGKFWEYAHAGYESGIGNLTRLADEAGLNTTEFNACLSSQKYKDKVMHNRVEAFNYGVSGVPTLFINGIKIVGVPTDAAIRQIIGSELAR